MPATKLPPLRELHFGELDATQEAARSPELLRKGYFDFREAAYSIASRGAWLLLGPKGAGKSAVLEYLKLTWSEREDRFFTHWELDSFPVLDVARMEVGHGGGQRAKPAWEFLLLLRLIESLNRDQGLRGSTEFSRLIRDLEATQLLTHDLATVATSVASNTWSVDFKLVKWTGARGWKPSSLGELNDAMRQTLATVFTENQHLLALDGLDTFFFEGGAGWESLSGLVDALHAVNNYLFTLDIKSSVVMTLRSDHFDALNSQNSNKLKDRTVFLDWSAGGIGAQNRLWEIVSRKAAVGRPEVKDLVLQYLGQPVTQPEFPAVSEYLLSYTRLLPRDVVAMMGHVQRVHPGSTPVSSDDAKLAAKEYAQEYFVGEMMNNLSGVLPPDEAHKVSHFRDALRTVPTKFFTFSDVSSELEGVLKPDQVRALLRRLFETGGIAVSNLSPRGVRYTDFIFRNVNGAAFSTRYEYQFHDALTRAWNRPWH